MKTVSLLVIAAGTLWAFTAQAAYDGRLAVGAGQYQYGAGGEFAITTTPDPGCEALGTFQSFCLEYNERVTFGVSYDYRINSGAVQGGNGANAMDPNTGLKMDNISIGTAYLYSLFRSGNLRDGTWDYFNPATRNANAGLLQRAFWYLEQEVDANNRAVGSLAVGSHFYNILSAGLGGNYGDWMADSEGRYGVVVLNIFDAKNNGVQDQLGVAPEPTTILAGALLLAPLGISAFRAARERRSRLAPE